MHIITREDIDFPALLDVLKASMTVGKFRKNGSIHVVVAADKFAMVSKEDKLNEIALQPCHDLEDAMAKARAILEKEAESGTPVDWL